MKKEKEGQTRWSTPATQSVTQEAEEGRQQTQDLTDSESPSGTQRERKGKGM